MQFGTQALVALFGPIPASAVSFGSSANWRTRLVPNYVLMIATEYVAGPDDPVMAPPCLQLTMANGVNVRDARACYDFRNPAGDSAAFNEVRQRLSENNGSASIPGTTIVTSAIGRFDGQGFDLTIGGPDPEAGLRIGKTGGLAYIDIDSVESDIVPPAIERGVPINGFFGITLDDPDAPWAVSVNVRPAMATASARPHKAATRPQLLARISGG